MLLEFSVENFLSFREKTTFSMLPHNSYKELMDGNITSTKGSRVPQVLNSAVIYGPNASGKTNLFKAFDFMRMKLLMPPGNVLSETDFKFGFGIQFKAIPSTFSVLFLTGNTIYDYMFSLQDGKVIHEKLESLENAPRKKWRLIFERLDDSEGVVFGNSLRGDKHAIYEKTRPETLFLKVLYEWNNKNIINAFEWFLKGVSVFLDSEGINSFGLHKTLSDIINKSSATNNVTEFIKNADFGIQDIPVRATDIEMSDNEGGKYDVLMGNQVPGILFDGQSSQIWDAIFKHKAVDEDGDDVFYDVRHKHEALGTRKLFALSGPILDFLHKGKTLIIDELTCSMHPLLTRAIIDLFHDPAINTKGAQLIFTTHDVNFLNKSIFRRDQIWFTKKNEYGGTVLNGLHDFNVRNDEALGAKYLMGAYGAIPVLDYKKLYQNNEESGKDVKENTTTTEVEKNT